LGSQPADDYCRGLLMDEDRHQDLSRRWPTGYCVCDDPAPADWYLHDAPGNPQPVTCMKCGRHWWIEGGRVVDGPPFVPFTDNLRRIQALGVDIRNEIDINGDEVRVPRSRWTLPPDDKQMPSVRLPNGATRFTWYYFPELNSWADRLAGVYEHDPLAGRRRRHRVYSRYYRPRYERDRDPALLMAYAQHDALALEEPWFRAALGHINDDGDVDTHRRITACLTGRAGGQRALTTTVEIIRRDLRAYRGILAAGRRLSHDAYALIGKAGGNPILGAWSVKEVRREYTRLWRATQAVVGLFTSEFQMLDSLQESANRIRG